MRRYETRTVTTTEEVDVGSACDGCGADSADMDDHPEDCDCPEYPLCLLVEPTLTCGCDTEEPDRG